MAVVSSAENRHREVFVSALAVISPLPTTVGFSPGSDVLSTSAADLGKSLDLMIATGVTSIRVPIPWPTVEPARGVLQWSAVDAVVDAAVARSMSVLGIVGLTPAWAVAPDAPPVNGRPASAEAFGAFAHQVAAHYSGRIAAYEIWNEPNGAMFFAPAPDPAAYTSLLKAAYSGIKAVSPSIDVIAGVLGSVADAPGMMNPVTFAQRMYDAGAKDSFDALSFHPYHYSLPFSSGPFQANSPVEQVMSLRTMMIAMGDGAKRIWASEYGEPTSAVDEATQDSMITDFLIKWQEMPYTGPIYVHSLRDRLTGSADPEDTFGLFRSDWTPKPAQQGMQWLLAHGIPTSAEFNRFAGVADPSYGRVLSPVFRATPTVWAQVRSSSTVYETAAGFVAAPNPIAAKAHPFGSAPLSAFTDGYQDFDSPSGLRFWYSAATGAHVAAGGIANAWFPALGLALTDEVPQPEGGVRVTFQHGYITWNASSGAVVTRL
jgi:hypothetical protein